MHLPLHQEHQLSGEIRCADDLVRLQRSFKSVRFVSVLGYPFLIAHLIKIYDIEVVECCKSLKGN